MNKAAIFNGEHLSLGDYDMIVGSPTCGKSTLVASPSSFKLVDIDYLNFFLPAITNPDWKKISRTSDGQATRTGMSVVWIAQILPLLRDKGLILVSNIDTPDVPGCRIIRFGRFSEDTVFHADERAKSEGRRTVSMDDARAWEKSFIDDDRIMLPRNVFLTDVFGLNRVVKVDTGQNSLSMLSNSSPIYGFIGGASGAFVVAFCCNRTCVSVSSGDGSRKSISIASYPTAQAALLKARSFGRRLAKGDLAFGRRVLIDAANIISSSSKRHDDEK